MKSDSKDATSARAWCRIIDYLEAEHLPLYNAMNACCASYSLSPSKGKSGVTLIMPSDTLLKKILTLTMSSNPDDIDKANDIINAHIIRYALKSGHAWMANKDNLPNALQNSQHVAIESATDREVTFKNGAKAVIDSKFIDGSRKRNLAVYKLTAGEIAVTDNIPAKPNAPVAESSKSGSADAAIGRAQRCSIVAAIGAVYKAEVSRRYRGIDAFTRAIYALVDVAMASDNTWFRDSVMPLVSKNHFTLFALVEPFRASGHLIPDHILMSWLQHGRNGDFECSSGHIASLDSAMLTLAGGSDAAIYANNAGVLAAIQSCRAAVFNQRGKPKGLVAAIESHYDTLERSNSIGGVSNVYPAAFAAWMQANSGLKLAYDELAFCSYLSFNQIESRGDVSKYNSDVGQIGSCLDAATPMGRAKSRLMLRRTLATAVAVNNSTIEMILTFTWSTCFLSVPIRAGVGKSVTALPTPDSIGSAIFNVEAAVEARLQSQIAATPRPSVSQLANRLNVSSLSAEEKEQLIAAIRG